MFNLLEYFGEEAANDRPGKQLQQVVEAVGNVVKKLKVARSSVERKMRLNKK